MFKEKEKSFWHTKNLIIFVVAFQCGDAVNRTKLVARLLSTVERQLTNISTKNILWLKMAHFFTGLTEKKSIWDLNIVFPRSKKKNGSLWETVDSEVRKYQIYATKPRSGK